MLCIKATGMQNAFDRRPCVYARICVEKEQGRGHGNSEFKLIIKIECVCFGLFVHYAEFKKSTEPKPNSMIVQGEKSFTGTHKCAFDSFSGMVIEQCGAGTMMEKYVVFFKFVQLKKHDCQGDAKPDAQFQHHF